MIPILTVLLPEVAVPECGATRFAGAHRFVFDPAAVADEDWATCQLPPTDPIHCGDQPPPPAIDLATIVADPTTGRVVLASLGGTVLSTWDAWAGDTDTTHLLMATNIAPDHGFVVTGTRWESIGWVLSGLVPVGWAGVE